MRAPGRISVAALASSRTDGPTDLDLGSLMPFQSSLVRYRTDELMHAQLYFNTAPLLDILKELP